jgi:hypothetical protein
MWGLVIRALIVLLVLVAAAAMYLATAEMPAVDVP